MNLYPHLSEWYAANAANDQLMILLAAIALFIVFALSAKRSR